MYLLRSIDDPFEYIIVKPLNYGNLWNTPPHVLLHPAMLVVVFTFELIFVIVICYLRAIC